jgi:hypothetical protein
VLVLRLTKRGRHRGELHELRASADHAEHLHLIASEFPPDFLPDFLPLPCDR